MREPMARAQQAQTGAAQPSEKRCADESLNQSLPEILLFSRLMLLGGICFFGAIQQFSS